ncbi:MAG: hypothetical protein CO127_06240 [Ignavibacteria bacterium CG_4_9_14_3_um_filter_36_18]|nr:T9SS type A sorting domain-containing protein [Ignavibacteria bacterium]PJB00964.1 MAG: hypothetical protein CO127_06240 [Ignavibacteria bacterium CG_4_9_14_3_um_filter_36_18]
MKRFYSSFESTSQLFYTFLAVILLGLFTSSSFAQISEGGIPYSFNANINQQVERVTMPAVNVAALLAEDEIEQSKGLPYRFGFPMDVNYNLNNSGTWTNLPGGAKLWRLNIFSSGATTINLIYNDFWLPQGSKFYIYNQNQSEVIGAFTTRNNNENGQFATGLVRGESVILEYYEPANVEAPGIISISTVIHGYKDVFKKIEETDGFGSSGSCNNNVNCPEGAPWANQIRSAAMILTASNSRLCSGSMVNNMRQDLTPYFLTANHCWSGTPATWIIMFNYQSPNCNNIDGPLNYTVQGTTTIAKNADSDFALLLLNTAPPDTYMVHFNGWSAEDVASTSSVGIHHPSGDIKKISWDNDPSSSADYEPSPYLPNSHWKITMWDDGTTEPGSSGSPLFDQNKRLIGQLHGGWASCTSLTADYYGKFAMSWNRGSTPATRLKDWLDPDNTGALILDGWDPTIGDPDTVAPTTIIDLAVVDPTSNSLTLNWTAPMDSSFGGVKVYDIRYSVQPINDSVSFYSAAQFSGIVPDTAGAAQNAVVDQLSFNSTYYFAIRSRDFWNNWSEISNVPTGTTLSAPQLDVSPDSLHLTLDSAATMIETILLSNISANPSTLTYTVGLDNNVYPSNSVSVKLLPVMNESSNLIELDKNENPLKEPRGMSIEGSGGPDLFGYKWIDSDEPNGPTYIWDDISTTGTLATNWVATGSFDPKDEGVAGPYSFGFNFKYYGNIKTQVYISSNGLLVFDMPAANIYTNAQIPGSSAPNDFIAPFWDDLDGTTQGTVHYKAEVDKFIVQFTNWQKYSATSSLTFQIVLYANGRIMFYYNNMNATLTSATVGIENNAGNDGLQIAYNAAYVHNGLAVKFAADPEWLASNTLGGMIYNGNSAAIELTFNSEDYPEGEYSMDVIVNSNDPSSPEIIIPVRMTVSYIVPVELASFTVEQVKNEAVLRWTSATETNNSGFEIEKAIISADKNIKQFQSAGFVKGNGTTTETVSYSFTDKNLNVGRYVYRLKQIDLDGTMEYSPEVEVEITAPDVFALYQNYPNPFNPSTTIEFSLPVKADVNLSIYNTLGELVTSLNAGLMEAGYHQIKFDASRYTSGTYIYRIKVNGGKLFSESKKMLLLK